MVARSPAAPASLPPGPARARAGAPALHGTAIDLLFGAGLAYVLTIPLLFVAAGQGLTTWSADVTAALALFVAGPHYGATLLRVYERRADRRKYVVFAVWITLGLLLAMAVGLRSVWVGSLLATLYVTWSPWHFAGQNYGIALMFLRRRGIPVEPGFKRWFYLSFVLSSLLAMLSIHSEASSLVYAQGAGNYRVYSILRAGIPNAVLVWLAPALGVLYLATLAAAARAVLRHGTARDLLEPALLVLTQALWFALPALGAMTGAYQMLGLAFAPVWISTAHAVQYLWVTSYYAQRSSPPMALSAFFAKAAAAGALLMITPALLFAPSLLGGRVVHFADAGVLVFAVVNLHHFLLDGAVWKLRDGRVASVLLRTDPSGGGAPPDEVGRSWLRPLVWTAGAACLVFAVYGTLAPWMARSTKVPLALSEQAHRVTTWLGRGDPVACHRLAGRHLALGRLDAALDDYRSCLHIVRTQLQQEPTPYLMQRLARLLLTVHPDDPASIAEARAFAEQAVRAAPDDVGALEALADAQAAGGDLAAAHATTVRAIEVARAAGAPRRVASLQRRLARLPADASAAAAPAAAPIR